VAEQRPGGLAAAPIMRRPFLMWMSKALRRAVRDISDRLGHTRVSMTHDRYLRRRSTEQDTADALERIIDEPGT